MNKKSKGFTLLEVLVAFTLLALIFGSIMEIIAGSARNARKASLNTKIAMLSQSKLDELGLYEKIEEGSSEGQFDDNTSWTLDIRPYEVPYDGDVSQEFSAVELMEINLVITAEAGSKQSSHEFHTLRAITPDFTRPRR